MTRKPPKRLWLATGLALTAMLVYFTVQHLSCGPCLQAADYALMHAIKSHLKRVGDVVSVASIHPGEWEQVCLVSGGFDLDVARAFTPKGTSQMSVINGGDVLITERYDESALVFVVSPTELELFQMIPQEMTYAGSSPACLDKHAAFFRVKGDRSRFSQATLTAANIATDYLEIELTSNPRD